MAKEGAVALFDKAAGIYSGFLCRENSFWRQGLTTEQNAEETAHELLPLLDRLVHEFPDTYDELGCFGALPYYAKIRNRDGFVHALIDQRKHRSRFLSDEEVKQLGLLTKEGQPKLLTEFEAECIKARKAISRAELAARPETSASNDKVPEHRDAEHSPDFRSVRWFDTSYTFTATQAACVRVLWAAWEAGTPDVGQDIVLERAGSESKRLQGLFQGNAAWGTMIAPGATKGSFRLREPGSE